MHIFLCHTQNTISTTPPPLPRHKDSPNIYQSHSICVDTINNFVFIVPSLSFMEMLSAFYAMCAVQCKYSLCRCYFSRFLFYGVLNEFIADPLVDARSQAIKPTLAI